ncbi:MAG TPA: DUF6390 family protein [Candidatus Deferrimicrobium sp.]|nr:DUF6390 family protein [Candidatus Deferrimicrobium sp.]
MLFARYAFGPNRLGLCGPEDWRSLLELGVAGAAAGAGADGARPRTQDAEPANLDARTRTLVADIDHGLRDLAARFEGAYPYLELIARAHGISDVMDRGVVDAYWIGNALSDQVDPGLMLQSMDARFRAQLSPEAWRWLEGKPQAGARPTHAFHVFDVFPRVGLMRGGAVTDAIKLMDSCRIRWGRVLEVKGEQLVVNAVPLGLTEGKLVLGEARSQTVRRWLDGTGFVSDVEVGDVVSLHWDWACEVLSPTRLDALQRRTAHQLGLANQTI